MSSRNPCPSCGGPVHRTLGITSGWGLNSSASYQHDSCPGSEAPEGATGCGAKLRRLVREDGSVSEWVEAQR